MAARYEYAVGEIREGMIAGDELDKVLDQRARDSVLVTVERPVG
jgi:hypothetical protein